MRNKKIVAVIPARMGASRFPGKPLIKILALPMVEHVRRRVMLSASIEEVYVATCDQEILGAVRSFGGKAIMTANTHERCTDRVEEAVKNIDADIVVIVQGDEPLFIPSAIEKLVQPILADDDIYCTNLFSIINNRQDLKDIDIVKAVLNKNKEIMCFSRSPIPYFRVRTKTPCYRQTGVSAFTKNFLSKFVSLTPTALEITESVDFLRILEHGYKIRAVVTSHQTFGVDRQEDVRIVEERLKRDPLQRRYYKKLRAL